jgi:murein DD-endopeptidase MepM/ murein hydrolase activator NlpD
MGNMYPGPAELVLFDMKLLWRSLGVAALLVIQQVVIPAAGLAQVDPCNPVPIPGLCPSPSPSPSPSPPPTDDSVLPGNQQPGGGGGGGGPTGGGNQKGGPGDGGQNRGNQGGGKKSGQGKQTSPVVAPSTPTGPFKVSSPNNSTRLVELLAPLQRHGLSLQEALLRVAGPFPVAGLSYWTDDWQACRDGCTRFHEGLDIFAQPGTPLVAIADGYVSQKLVGELSGISVEITDAQGIQYFYAHLSAWAEGLRPGMQVQTGQVLGYMGNTGNAISTPAHLHLEVQPGGVPVPPKPFVDRWLKIAEIEAQELAARYTGKAVPETSDFRLTRLFDLAGGGEILEAGAQRLVVLAGIQPSVSGLEMAQRVLGQMAWEIDWAGQADAQLAQLAQAYDQAAGAQDLAGASPWAPLGITPQQVEFSGGVPELGD